VGRGGEEGESGEDEDAGVGCGGVGVDLVGLRGGLEV